MVVTVEPGLYIDEKRFEEPSGWIAKNTPSEAYKAFVDAVRPAVKKFAGIGIRIEDDVLVTDSGREVLSSGAPKRIEDIEATMREGFRGRRHVH
jgi:Xaa-Pro aminopeptidase